MRLSAENITVRYGDRDVVRGVSFDLPAGNVTALLGPNGAGKTTLLRTLNGRVVPASGLVNLDGEDIVTLSRPEIARRIAVVAQENETRFPVTVREYVLAGRFAHGSAFGWESESDVAAATRAMSECGLESYADRQMNELSGGERQRVVLARALATDAKVLLLDEPAANLDIEHQGMMFRLVRDRSRERECSAIVITHDLNIASEFADQILLLKDGAIVAAGTPEDVLTEENIASAYNVKVLLDTNPASGKKRVTTIYGS